MHKPKFMLALGLFNVAVFVLATLFLPSAGTFSYDNPLANRPIREEVFVILSRRLLEQTEKT